MVYKCCVAGCKTGYTNGPTGTVVQFPDDETERSRWCRALPNAGFVWTSGKRICLNHWPAGYRGKTARNGTIIPLDPPSKFHDVAPSCIPTPSGKPRKVNSFVERNSHADQLEEFTRRDLIDAKECVATVLASNDDVICYLTVSELCVLAKERTGSVHAFSVYVNLNTKQSECYSGVQEVAVAFLENGELSRHSALNETLHFLRNYNLVDKKAQFCKRQIELLNSKQYNSKDYAEALQLRCSSAAAYERFREFLVLPSLRTLRKVTKFVNDSDDIAYYKAILSNLEDRSRVCCLLFDEIYVKPGLQYQGSRVFGEASNHPGSLAKTMLGVMVTSVCGSFEHCVKVLPVAALDSKFLLTTVRDTISLLHGCGATIVALVSDNHRINQALYESLRTDPEAPWRCSCPITGKPLFLLTDSVHLCKSIRNNWICDRTKELLFATSPEGDMRVAKWSAIEMIFKQDRNELFTQTSLTRSAVYPNNIERQNVMYFRHVFSDKTVAALELADEADTAAFVAMITRFWKICNVKAPNLDLRYKDKFRAAVHVSHPWQHEYLEKFADCVMRMCPSSNRSHAKCLTRDTAVSTANTCQGLAALSNYMFGFNSLNVEFVLLGNLSTDPLERHFGKFRQGCGGAYLVTVRAITEKHRIYKANLAAKLEQTLLSTNDREKGICGEDCHSCSRFDVMLIDILPLLADELESRTKEILLYVAGYVVRKHELLSDSDTFTEYSVNRRYFDKMNRGGLVIPPDTVVNFMYFVHIAFSTLTANGTIPCFTSVMSYCRHINAAYGFNFSRLDAVCRTVSNIFLNNFSSTCDAPTGKEPQMKLLKLAN